MHKLIAIVNVIAWAGFWAFGYLALSAGVDQTGQLLPAAVMAALGAAVGLWAYFKLIRYTEATGYAKPPNRADRSHLDTDDPGEIA